MFLHFFIDFDGKVAELIVDRANLNEIKPIYLVCCFYCFKQETFEIHKL